MSEFCDWLGIYYNYVKPCRYPKSNELANKGVNIAKSILKRSDEGKVDKQLMLLEYRNIAIIGSKFSPSQLLKSRTLRSKIPILNNSLESILVNNFKLVPTWK